MDGCTDLQQKQIMYLDKYFGTLSDYYVFSIFVNEQYLKRNKKTANYNDFEF